MFLENRLIAMLDVLGLANRLGTKEGLVETTAAYAELIGRAKGHMFSPKAVPGSPSNPEPNFEYGQFVFDTLVLVSYPLDVKSTYRFVFATVLLMELFFAERFPLRGSIGRGNFCTDEKGHIFLSDTFKRLRLFEEKQQWSGCILLEEVEDVVLTSLLGWSPHQALHVVLPRSAPMHRLAVPVKVRPDDLQPHWCLNWSYFLAPTTIAAGLKHMAADRVKRDNTTSYIQTVGKLDDDAQVLAPEFLPARTLKTMKARSGVRVKFEDEQGNGVKPGCEQWTFAAYERDV